MTKNPLFLSLLAAASNVLSLLETICVEVNLVNFFLISCFSFILFFSIVKQVISFGILKNPCHYKSRSLVCFGPKARKVRNLVPCGTKLSTTN